MTLNTINKLALALLCLVAQPVHAAAMCQLADLTDARADDARCYFYMGTAAYRADDFAKAAKHWKDLIALKTLPAEFVALRTNAYNNLGFLYFYGNGVTTNKKAAIDYWKFAAKAGNEESFYHLCHAHADRDEASYDPRQARGYCRQALKLTVHPAREKPRVLKS